MIVKIEGRPDRFDLQDGSLKLGVDEVTGCRSAEAFLVILESVLSDLGGASVILEVE